MIQFVRVEVRVRVIASTIIQFVYSIQHACVITANCNEKGIIQSIKNEQFTNSRTWTVSWEGNYDFEKILSRMYWIRLFVIFARPFSQKVMICKTLRVSKMGIKYIFLIFYILHDVIWSQIMILNHQTCITYYF